MAPQLWKRTVRVATLFSSRLTFNWKYEVRALPSQRILILPKIVENSLLRDMNSLLIF